LTSNTIRRLILSSVLLLFLAAHAGEDASLSSSVIPSTSGNIFPLLSYRALPVRPSEELAKFVSEVATGEKDQLTGVFAAFTFAFPIVSQPEQKPAWISGKDGVVTSFSLAGEAGSTGLLAHYERAGKAFYNLKLEQLIQLIYGDGEIKTYRVSEIRFYRALSPSDPLSNFATLDPPGQELTQEELFDKIYKVSGRLVLQTCLEGKGINTWGRMFVIAEPVEK
jgi:hypothetical protein